MGWRKEQLRIAVGPGNAAKRAFHFCSPGVVRRKHVAALQVRPAAVADAAAVYRQFDD